MGIMIMSVLLIYTLCEMEHEVNSYHINLILETNGSLYSKSTTKHEDSVYHHVHECNGSKILYDLKFDDLLQTRSPEPIPSDIGSGPNGLRASGL